LGTDSNSTDHYIFGEVVGAGCWECPKSLVTRESDKILWLMVSLLKVESHGGMGDTLPFGGTVLHNQPSQREKQVLGRGHG